MNTKQIKELVQKYKSFSRGIVNYKRYTHYAVTHHSTVIEGSTLTASQVINLIEHGKPAAKKPFEHHLMVTDHYNALLFVIEKAKKKESITLSFIQEIAAKLMNNTGSIVNTMTGTYDISKGDLRLNSVRAGTRRFPEAKKVKRLIVDLIAELNLKMQNAKTLEDKLKLSFYAHFHLVSIHPFGDGNGRTSRLLMNYIQQYFKLPLSTVLKSDRLKYIEALEKARKNNDITSFYNFMFRQYAKFLKAEIKNLSK